MKASIIRFVKRGLRVLRFVLNPLLIYKRDSLFRLQSNYLKNLNNVPINEKMIMYESYHGKNMTCSPLAIFETMIHDPEYKDMLHVWALNDIENYYAQQYSHYPNVTFVKVNSTGYIKALTESKYLINNVTFPPYFQKKEGQVYINTWHGTPLKTLGKDMKGTPGQHKNIQRNLLHSDYIFNPNRFTADTINKSHDLEGIYDGFVVDEGYPRIDNTINNQNPERIRKILNIDINKKIILYAPTWRGEVGKVNNISDNIEEILATLSSNIPEGYTLLLKVHTLVFKHIQQNNKLAASCVPDWVDTNELLSVVDVLITDYSSIFFDYMKRLKPILFFVYDRKQYEEERGLYLNLEDMPGPLCYSNEELINNLHNINEVHEKYYETHTKLIEQYNYNDDGHASDRFKQIVFKNNYSDYNVYQISDNKKRILMYCGGFANNGITSSAINLLNNIDYSQYHVVVIDKENYDNISGYNLNRLNSNVKVLYRTGSMNVSIKELYYHLITQRLGLTSQKRENMLPRSLYKRELLRLIGSTKFDIAIDFSGYVPFWSLLFSQGDFKNRVIYQHNDMYAEYNKIIQGEYKHKRNLNVIFPLYKEFDKIISVAEYTRDLNVKNLHQYMPVDKSVYVHNCIDYKKILDQLKHDSTLQINVKDYLLAQKEVSYGRLSLTGVRLPEKSNINFINMGRLSPEKDQEKLIHAFAKVAKNTSNARLYIVGEGVLEKKLKNLVLALHIQDKVFFTGHITNPFVLMNLCDCFILSSNHEGQPMVLLEALVLEMPIIATNIAGSRSILQNQYGNLVENSEDGLIEGMNRFILSNEKYQKFDYQAYNVDALKMFYNQVCNTTS